MSKVEYSTSTDGDTMTDKFIWTVPKFLDVLNNKSMRELRMPEPEDADAEGRFHLKMRFLGPGNDTIEICYLSPIRLILKSEFIISHSILNDWKQALRNEQRVLVTNVNYINQRNQWQHLGALLKRDILSNNYSFLKKDQSDPSLCLIIKFTVFQTKYDSYFKYVGESNDAETQLSHDFEHLLTSEVFSDVTIKSIEGKEYKAHKNVLASRSVVLKAHFEHNTTECQTNIIESHFEDEVLKEVLAFIYSNKAPRVDEIPEKLLAAADFYQLRRLKYLCVEALAKRLTAENAEETQELANLYSAKNLNRLARKFITEG